ncbi:hypothetical protein MRS76_02870 [Rhizobiaceae bacterium n13]|uniref:Lipoprotein n=1 Tax=Ferirhizobium litorale TaxID=2927786 RepID=A0AAE3QCV8_9HYPH|nr:hypothetical protein [Fererhizobium litorale]MDI7860888.1 hypothetical protein [Fererhizobium litorale]MDI7921036.1 hypothetical protein [Fererhizobium litorale]
MCIAGAVSVLAGAVFALSSCNTTDALTPQVDVGGGLYPDASSPVTQAETERLAGMHTSPQSTIQQQPTNQPTDAGGGPQNTLEAQAHALAHGQSAASAPLEGTQPAAGAATDGASSGQASASVASGQNGSIRFLPIIGAPVQAVTPLSRELGAQARSHGLTIKSSTDTSSEHILKGYFSAFGDEGKVTVVYVWDVLDTNGSRLHRIQGQVNVRGSGREPWTSVPPTLMQQIGQRTIDEYMQWKQARAG